MTKQELLSRNTITVVEAAQWLGIGTGTAYRAAENKTLPGVVRVGGRWLVIVEKFVKELGIEEKD